MRHIWNRICKQSTSKRWETYENFYADMKDRPHKFLCRKNRLLPFSKRNCYWSETPQPKYKNIFMIKGKSYATAREAGKANGVTDQAILTWCYGYYGNNKYYPPKPDCSIIKL